LVSYDSGASQLIFEPVFGTGSTDSARGDWFAVASNEVDLIDGRVTTLESNIKVLDRYQARDTAGTEVNVGASLAGVTVSLTGTVFYVSNPTNCIITSLEIYWPNTSGDSFDVVLDYNGMPHDSPTSRFTASIYALREQDGAPVAGASARPDPSNYDRIKVMGLSGATSYIVRLLLL
jgi:hypothetical protein